MVVAGAVNTTHIRGTGFQLILGPKTTHIRLMMLQVLGDQAHFKALFDRLPKEQAKTEEQPKPFNLADHKIVKRLRKRFCFQRNSELNIL